MTGEIIHQRRLRNNLIVGLKTNLRSTWEKFLTEHLPLYTLFFDWPSYRDHQKAWFKEHGEYDFCILLMHYEAMGKVVDKMTRWGHFDQVVYDEVHKNKARNSANSRYARRLRGVPFRIGLSGTPMDNSPNDMWAVMRFIDHKVLGVQWKDYQAFFTKPGGYMGYKDIFRKERHHVFLDRIRPFVYRVTKQEAGIEPASVKYVSVEMDPKQQRMYDELERDMILELDNDDILVTLLKIVQNGKLQQITGGKVKDEDGDIHRVGRAKERVLTRLLNKYDAPLVIFCKYSHEIEMCRRIALRFYDRVEVLTGKIKDRKFKRKADDLARTDLLRRFQAGEIDVLVAQQKTGGVGVDMYRARLAIVYSCNHSFIDFDQMVSRLDFMGQTIPAKFLVLYVPDTIDSDIRKAIKLKTSVTQATLDRLRRKKGSFHHGERYEEKGRERFAGRKGRGRSVVQVRRLGRGESNRPAGDVRQGRLPQARHRKG